MAAEVQLKIVADAAQANEQTKGLKQQLREATKEAQNLIAAGKENTAEYAKARNEVAQLQDKMRDFNDELKALDPGAKFQAIAGVTSGIAGGFAAAQGAMALFGAESEEVEKALLKVQSAMAIAQGLDQVRELGKSFNLAKTAIMGGVQSLGKMRTALIATGVGAFAVAVGAIVANWEELTKWIDKTYPKLGGVANIFDNIKKVAMGSLNVIIEYFKAVGEMMVQLWSGEWGNLVETAKGLGARMSKAYTEGYVEEEKNQAKVREAAALESQIKTHQRQIKLMEAQGKETYGEKKKALEEELRLIELQNGKETDAYKDKYLELQILEVEHQKSIKEKIEKANEEKIQKHQEYLHALDEWHKQYVETNTKFQKILKDKEREEENKRFEERAARFQEQLKATTLRNKYYEEQFQKDNALNFEARRQHELEQYEKIKNDQHRTLSEKLAAEIAYAENSKKIAQDELNYKKSVEEAKYTIAYQSLNAITSLGNLLISNDAKLRKFQKAAAITQIAIDTAKAISTTIANATQAASAGGPAAPFLAATYIATGIAQVLASMLKAKQALSAAGDGGGNLSLPSAPAGGGGGFGGTGTPQAPVNAFTPQGARTTITNQEGQGANALGQIQVFVTEGDISTTQQRVGSIRKKATVVQ